MKKIATGALVVFILGLGVPNWVLSSSTDDIQAIKKAVKENPDYEKGKEAKWLKILVTESKTEKVKVKVTLPLTLVEWFVKAAEDECIQINQDEVDIDLKELFAELKRLGPAVLIEVYEDGEIVKIWLE